MNKTTDDNSYYGRVGKKKIPAIQNYIRGLSSVTKIYDVGCNNGSVSAPLRDQYEVSGIDLSTRVTPPEDYDFRVADIATDNKVVMNDCTIFLSLYHHILGNYGLEIADDVFLKLLLRTKHLIFDTGNVSERRRSSTYWAKAQGKLFGSEEALLQHFKLPHKTLCKWKCGGGSRRVVAFESSSWDNTVSILGTYRRKSGAKAQKHGLVPADTKGAYQGCVFHKLRWGDKVLFAKKRIEKFADKEKKELDNIIRIYGSEDPPQAPTFYGVSPKYGLVFEWLEDIEYVKKTRLRGLRDVDEVRVDGETLFLDFER